MRNIKLIIEYDGTGYAGWQIQARRSSGDEGRGTKDEGRKKRVKKEKKTVQETLEKALAQLLQEKIRVIGSGRTDAGVHAQGQVANFKTKSKLNCKNIQKGLNGILPKDIRIKQAEPAHPDFHARFSARSKLYRYSIVNHSFVSPFLRRHCYLVRCALDAGKMRRAADELLGKHNFRSFQAVDKKQRPSARTILRLDIRRNKHLIYLDIQADGFLYRMVRNIAGTLIEVGRGRLRVQDIKEILKAKDRKCAGPCAPAKGLCLMDVKYKKG